MNRQQKALFFMIILGGLVTWMWQDSSLSRTILQPVAILTQRTASQKATSIRKALSFENRLKIETQKISQIDLDPAATEQSLREWARTLNQEELETLFKRALDLSISQDERFLDVMLLGWSRQAQAQLESIALHPMEPGISYDFERVLRMKAVEFIDAETNLNHIISKSSETAIIDRAQRSLWAARGLAPSPEEQDNAALGRLLRDVK